ncbi:MAG: proline iminopeptidase [Gaiellales bacterium]|jgi:proline iminopeptidase|nr:proline iminopeptidase [Gaiellales bacterium]
MSMLYPEIEPYAHGMLDAGDGNLVYWETCGNPRGKPAVVLHGGPGSGCTPWQRRLFHPTAYRIVLFDQRGCGRSTPHAGEPETDLTSNTTAHLLGDIELLRQQLGIERWLVAGGSWGSALALTYAETFPHRVSELALWGVTTGRRGEADWIFRGGVAPLFPEQWHRLCAGLPASERGDVVAAYRRLLHDPDPGVRERAALDWCTWESATPSWPPTDGLDPRFADPRYAMAFARLVTHYVHHDLFLDEGSVLRDIGKLAGIPAVMVHGRFDLQAPLTTAWELSRAWPSAELVIVDGAGHAANHSGITEELLRATGRFARP